MKQRTIKIWTFILSTFFIVATFEASFSILRQYTSHLEYRGLDISMLSKIMLVAAIDMAIFFTMSYITSSRNVEYKRNLVPAKIMLVLGSMVSTFMNGYYMYKFAPDWEGAQTIGVIVGVLAVTMVALLGWISGDQRIEQSKPAGAEDKPGSQQSPVEPINYNKPTPKRQKRSVSKKQISFEPPPAQITATGESVQPAAVTTEASKSLQQRISDMIINNPRFSNRRIARQLDCHHATVGRIRKKLQATGRIPLPAMA